MEDTKCLTLGEIDWDAWSRTSFAWLDVPNLESLSFWKSFQGPDKDGGHGQLLQWILESPYMDDPAAEIDGGAQLNGSAEAGAAGSSTNVAAPAPAAQCDMGYDLNEVTGVVSAIESAHRDSDGSKSETEQKDDANGDAKGGTGALVVVDRDADPVHSPKLTNDPRQLGHDAIRLMHLYAIPLKVRPNQLVAVFSSCGNVLCLCAARLFYGQKVIGLMLCRR